MIPYSTNPKPVHVGYWFHQAGKYNYSIPAGNEGHIIVPRIHEVRFDKPDVCYTGLLHGFGVEGDGEERCVVALVEKPDGTFNTPSVNVIQLIHPTPTKP